MVALARIISTDIVRGWRWPKFSIKSLADVNTAWQAAPVGTDAVPRKNTVAVYSETLTQGKPVILGYINLNQLAGEGEHRTFSEDAAGNVKFYIWQKADGTCEIGGTGDFMVRYNEMAAAFQEVQDDVNNLKQLISTWVVVSGDGGGALKTILGSWAGAPLVEDITKAKIAEVKTIPFTP